MRTPDLRGLKLIQPLELPIRAALPITCFTARMMRILINCMEGLEYMLANAGTIRYLEFFQPPEPSIHLHSELVTAHFSSLRCNTAFQIIPANTQGCH